MPSTNWRSSLNAVSTGAAWVAACGIPSPAATSVQFSSAYAYATSGNAVAWALLPSESANLTDFYFYCTAVAGTGTTTLRWEIREGLNGSSIPGTTLIASGGSITVNATGWQLITGLSVALTAGKLYMLVIADPSGNVTNNITIYSGAGSGSSSARKTSQGSNTTAGFASGNTGQAKQFYGAVKIGADWIGGLSVDTTGGVTSGTYERGCRFRLAAPMTFIGLMDAASDAYVMQGAVISLYDDNTAPLGTPLTSFTLPTFTLGGGTAPANGPIVFPVASWYDCAPNVWYRMQLKPASNSAVPRKSTGAATIPANVRAATFPLGGDCYWSQNTSGSWVDDANAMGVMGPVFVPSAGGVPSFGQGSLFRGKL